MRGARDTSAKSGQRLTNLSRGGRSWKHDEEFTRQRAELGREQIGLNQRLRQLGSERWLEPSRNLFLFSNRAIFWLTHGNPDEKRLILSTVGSNPTLKVKQLSIDAKKPFRILQERRSLSTLQTKRVSIRLSLTLPEKHEVARESISLHWHLRFTPKQPKEMRLLTPLVLKYPASKSPAGE